MLTQAEINQQLQANIFYATGKINLLATAIIKDAYGNNITLEWGIEEKSPIIEERQHILHKNDELEEVQVEEKTSKRFVISGNNIVEAGKEKSKENIIEASTKNVVEKKEETVIETQKEVVDKVLETTKDTTSYKSTSTSKNSQQQNIKTYYGISTTEAFNFQLGIGGKIQKSGQWVNATSSEIQKYFIPSEKNIQKYKYQFLNLASPAGISEKEAKAYLSNKGILRGKEAVFISAAKANNVNEIYLMAHACLETGNGTSKLATGVNYKGQIVYNMFGIGAVDSDPITKGAEYAYKMGWTTPEKAILGGTEFISTNYINNYPYNQDTLYEMRWNPASPGRHQYATDIAWATKQAVWIEQIYKSFAGATVTFDIPVYRK